VTAEYNDEYPTCAGTHATVCVYHADLDPAEVTARLGVASTTAQRRGDTRPSTGRVSIGAWFLSSVDAVASRDLRRHIDWVLDELGESAAVLAELRAAGCKTIVSCYWTSAAGHGGPTVSPEQMARLAASGLEVSFDVYFASGVEAV
jgi:hypothetical protein